MKQNIRVDKCHSNNDRCTQHVICNIVHFSSNCFSYDVKQGQYIQGTLLSLTKRSPLKFWKCDKTNITICYDSASTRWHVCVRYIFTSLIVYCPIQSSMYVSVQQGGLFASRVWWFRFVNFNVDREYFYYKKSFCYLDLRALFNEKTFY